MILINKHYLILISTDEHYLTLILIYKRHLTLILIYKHYLTVSLIDEHYKQHIKTTINMPFKSIILPLLILLIHSF